MARVVLRALLALSLVAGLGSCTGRVRGGGPSEPDSTFTLATYYPVITTWDPGAAFSSELVAMQNVYETLTKYDPLAGKVEPRLATSWESTRDSLSWTFHLRHGVTFHSGRALDATSVKQSIERTIKLGKGAYYIWSSVKKIKVVNADTVRFTLKYAAPLDRIASAANGAYVYDVEASGPEKFAGWVANGKDAGSGPYKVTDYDQGNEIEVKLGRYDDYWGGWKDGQFANVVYRVTPETSTALQLLESGDVSMIQKIPPGQLDQVKARKGIAVSQTSSFENLIALFNTRSGPLADVKVRQALQDAIDVKGLVSVGKGSESVPSGFVPKGLLGFTPNLEGTYDLGRARQRLESAGYGPEGRHLSLRLTYASDDRDQQQFVTLLTSALDRLGVTLKATPLEFGAQAARARSGNLSSRQDIFVMYWYPDYADAISWMQSLFHSESPVVFNLSYLHDDAIDRQVDRLPRLTSSDPDEASRVYATLQKELIGKLAAGRALYVTNYQRAYRDDIKGFVDNPAYAAVPFVHDLSTSS